MRLRRAGAGQLLLALALLGTSAPGPICSLAPAPPAALAGHRGAACAAGRRRPTAAGRCGPPEAAQGAADAAEVADAEPEQGFYEVLGVAADADPAALKAAYRQAARAAHPDLADPAERGRMQERFEAVNRAYEVLSDPEKKLAYDLRGLAGLAEFEFDGERIIMPPPWRVRVGHTGHHFWKREEYFVGLMMETIDIPVKDIREAYAEATKDPVGVGQAILVQRTEEKRALQIVDALEEFGLACMAEEVEEENVDEVDVSASN